MELTESITIEGPAGGTNTGPVDLLPVELRRDSGWITIAYASGFDSTGTSGAFSVRRIGKTVYAKGGWHKTSGDFAVVASTVCATLPDHVQPPGTLRIAARGTNSKPAIVSIFSTGVVQAGAADGYGTGIQVIDINTSWRVA